MFQNAFREYISPTLASSERRIEYALSLKFSSLLYSSVSTRLAFLSQYISEGGGVVYLRFCRSDGLWLCGCCICADMRKLRKIEKEREQAEQAYRAKQETKDAASRTKTRSTQELN
jgi:hypothetical protein